MLLHTIGKLGGVRGRPTRSPTNGFSPAIICRRSARCGGERESAADRQRHRDLAAALRLYAAPLAGAGDEGAG